MKYAGWIFVFTILVYCSCTLKRKEVTVYHRFDKNSWPRYNNIIFNIPIEESNNSFDIFLFAKHSPSYEFDNLDFGMIMNTPSGEERINQYEFKIKKKFGGFIGKCDKDSCEAVIPIKRGIVFNRKGILKIEIENLVPRLEVRELYGVGIKVVPFYQ